MERLINAACISVLGVLTGLCAPLPGQDAARPDTTTPATTEQQGEKGLNIATDSLLPDTYPEAPYNVALGAEGGVPPLHWRLEKGALPPGIKLLDHGQLTGRAERTGEFQFTIAVIDSGQPQSAVEKVFTVWVHSALDLRWKTPAHVNGNRIEGSVDVSNTTLDNVDLTFVVLAVQSNGRATAIGYQHFVLPRGTVEKELPFGETLPSGAYVVHVDTVGEVAPKKLIYRERMETPSVLRVTVGP